MLNLRTELCKHVILKYKQKVKYIHPFDTKVQEYGYISSINNNYVFVKFDAQLSKLGWKGTTSQCCERNCIKLIDNKFYEGKQ